MTLQAIPKTNHWFPCRDEMDIISVSQAMSLILVVPLPVFMYVQSCAHERVYMCVRVCVRARLWNWAHIHAYVRTHPRTHVRMYMYVCIDIFMYFTPLVSPMCVRVRLSLRARTYIHTYVCMHACIDIFIYVTPLVTSTSGDTEVMKIKSSYPTACGVYIY